VYTVMRREENTAAFGRALGACLLHRTVNWVAQHCQQQAGMVMKKPGSKPHAVTAMWSVNWYV